MNRLNSYTEATLYIKNSLTVGNKKVLQSDCCLGTFYSTVKTYLIQTVYRMYHICIIGILCCTVPDYQMDLAVHNDWESCKVKKASLCQIAQAHYNKYI